MKKKLTILIAAMVLLSLILAFFLDRGSEAQDACEAFFDAYSSVDPEASGALLTGPGSPYSFGAIGGIMARNTSAKLGRAHGGKRSFTVPAAIETLDLAGTLSQVPITISSRETAGNWLQQALPNAPKVVIKTDVRMVKDEAGWKVEMTPELADALMGGYFSLLHAAAEEVDAA